MWSIARWSGGGANVLHTFTLRDQKRTRTSPDPPEVSRADRALVRQHAFQSGITWNVKAQKLYALDIDAGTIRVLEAGVTKHKAKIGGRPYDVVLARNRSRLYVSDWANGRVLAVNPEDLGSSPGSRLANIRTNWRSIPGSDTTSHSP